MEKKKTFTEAPKQRLILVDIENLAGGSQFVSSTVADIKHELTALLNLTDNDMIIIASGRYAYPGWAFAWQNVGRRVNSGINGADYEILQELDNVRPGRFSEVVVASGDGIFTDSISKLGGKNIPVTVLACTGSCSKRLVLAASNTILYTPSYDIVEAA